MKYRDHIYKIRIGSGNGIHMANREELERIEAAWQEKRKKLLEERGTVKLLD